MKKTKLLIGLLPGIIFAQNSQKDTLKPKETIIEEVIFTGYQKIEKSKVTSSVETVKLKNIEQKATASIDQMLQGKVAGVMITPVSGTPGQIAPIRIRGTASFNGDVDPLWVLDGVPLEGNQVPNFNASQQDINELRNYSIAGFNPEDIEEITILKDASATAIYGARAANGVILVTTKKGKRGRMNINFSSNTFIGLRPNFSKLNLMNSNQKVDFELMMAGRADLDHYRKNNGAVARILEANKDWDNFRNGGFSAISALSQQQINNLRNTNTNWGNLLYRNAINQQHSVNISGGSDNHTYYASFGYYDEKSTVIGSSFERFNLTLKNNFKVNDKLNIGVSLFGTNTKQNSFLFDSGSHSTPTAYSRTANPYLAPVDAAGNYIYDEDINYIERLYGADTRVPYNYIEERNNTKYELGTRSIRGILDLEYKILKGLEFRSQLGVLLENQKTEKYASEDTYFMRKRRGNSYQAGKKTYFIPNGGYYNVINGDSFDYNWKNILEYNKNIDKHSFNILAGAEIRKTKYNSQNSQMYGYDPRTKNSVILNVPDEYKNSPLYRPNHSITTENAYASFYGTLSYTYNNRYTFFGSVRRDGTSLFGAEARKRWNPIWAASLAWNIKNENFLKNSKTISTLKVRGSYGLQGNYDRNTTSIFTGVYDTTSILNKTETTIGKDGAPNPNLKWEKTTTIDLGLNLGLWNNRLNFTFDLYQRKGVDLLDIRELPSETGFSNTSTNWAKLTNKGFELAISSVNIDKENFRWTTNFNISANRSNVDVVSKQRRAFYPSGQGYPVNAIFGIRTAGLDANGIPQFYNNKGEIVSAIDFYKLHQEELWFPGSGIFNTYSKIKNEDFDSLYSYLGNRDPKFFGGITNTFNIKNWEFSIATSFNIEQTVQGSAPYKFTNVDRGLNGSTQLLDAWSPNNTNTYLPRIISSSTLPDSIIHSWFSSNSDQFTYDRFDIWTKKVSFIRVNNIKIGYNLPQDLLHSTGIKSMRLTLEGRNLFVFGTNYNGYFDPETYGNIYAQPIQKSVVFGLNIGF